MSKGSYTDFRDALRAFESGWDRDRYDAGRIVDRQLDEWAGGPVGDHFPGYTSWGALTDAEWTAMSYQSTNALGFVGYQFGEALLIDLGYYQDDQFYGNGASTNTWDGTWTGKNGATSLDAFKTADVQEIAIQEAFAFNLNIIETNLGYSGQSLSDFIGTTTTYNNNGVDVNVTLTLTGIMAAAHLRGAFGTLALLQGGAVSQDEYGTSILRYIDQFGGYDSPSVADMIAGNFDGPVIGGGTPPADPGEAAADSGVGDPTGGGGTSPHTEEGTSNAADFDNAAITEANATVTLTWSYGSQTVVSDFDPAQATILIDWIGSADLEIAQTAEGLVFAIPSNNQSLTLAGVTLADLVSANIHAKDATARAELAGLIGGDGHGGGHGGMTGMMYQITANTVAQVIDGFDPAVDMIHIDADVTGAAFEIFEESGDALGTTVRIAITTPDLGTQQIVFTGVSLNDLGFANFSIADADVLDEVVTAIGAVIPQPGGDTGGYELSYDTDGSNPVAMADIAAGGTRYIADANADDVVGFDPATDVLDFGGNSVHGMIVTKSQFGEIVVDSPWSAAAQIIQGVTFQDVTIENFGVVGNEHLRQDFGGVLSWELGVGPRAADTVYIRSHEYGISEVVENFDPATMNISFLYFGTRERLRVENVGEDLVISSLPSGQSMTLKGVQLEQIIPGRVEFHHDQVMEDNLEVPFGFAQDDVTLVDRTMLLTPQAPSGATTDGAQTRLGDMTGAAGTGGGDIGEGGPDVGGSDPDTGGGDTTGGTVNGVADTVKITHLWGVKEVFAGQFDTSEDVIDFGWMQGADVAVSEVGDDLVFEVLNNGGHTVTLTNLQAEDLSRGNLAVATWNDILADDGMLLTQLIDLGFGDII